MILGAVDDMTHENKYQLLFHGYAVNHIYALWWRLDPAVGASTFSTQIHFINSCNMSNLSLLSLYDKEIHTPNTCIQVGMLSLVLISTHLFSSTVIDCLSCQNPKSMSVSLRIVFVPISTDLCIHSLVLHCYPTFIVVVIMVVWLSSWLWWSQKWQ